METKSSRWSFLDFVPDAYISASFSSKLGSSRQKSERKAWNDPKPPSLIHMKPKQVREAMFYAGRSHPEDFLRRVRSLDRDGTIVNTPTALAFNEILVVSNPPVSLLTFILVFSGISDLQGFRSHVHVSATHEYPSSCCFPFCLRLIRV